MNEQLSYNFLLHTMAVRKIGVTNPGSFHNSKEQDIAIPSDSSVILDSQQAITRGPFEAAQRPAALQALCTIHQSESPYSNELF